MAKKVIIIGDRGTGAIVASIIEDNRNRYNDTEWEIAGFLSREKDNIYGFPVLGTPNDVETFLEDKNLYFVFAYYFVANEYATYRWYKQMRIPQERYATIIHKSAFIGLGTTIGNGCIIEPNSYISCGTTIGDNVCIMSNCCVGHDAYIGKLCHLSYGSIVGSYCKLGECTDICARSFVQEHKILGDFVCVGAGSVATHNISSGELWTGTPARFKRYTKEKHKKAYRALCLPQILTHKIKDQYKRCVVSVANYICR